MTKDQFRTALLEKLDEDMKLLTAAAELARDEAISEESRAENKWDTHSQEAAYLAEGQARIAAEIAENLEFYRSFPLPEFNGGSAIAPGALVELSGKSRSAWYFVGPRAGGVEVELDGRTVVLVTPQSPLGKSLLGRRAGDELPAGRKSPAQRILSVK